ncbi:MAG: rod shape-determining protein MreC [Actinomycetota bacterium]
MALQRKAEPQVRPLISLGFLLILALLLVFLDAKANFGPINLLRSTVSTISVPLQSTARNIAAPVESFFQDWTEVGSKNQIIKELRQQNSKLRLNLLTLGNSQRELRKLQETMQLAGLGNYRIVPAQVMSIGAAEGFGSTVLLDAGSNDGIKVNMSVISGNGMIGRVQSTTSHTATVVLLTDASSNIGARVAGSGEIGFLSGRGLNDSMRLTFIDPKAKVVVGDRLVTYGVSGGIFSPGLPIGVVTKVETIVGANTKVAYVQPFTNLSQIDLVGVIVSKSKWDPRDSLLPNVQPTPTVTVTITANPVAPTPSESAS